MTFDEYREKMAQTEGAVHHPRKRFFHENGVGDRIQRDKEVLPMVQVSALEFESNPRKYYAMVSRQDVAIVSDGKKIAILTSPAKRRSVLDDLVGVIPNEDYDIKAIRRERHR
jgi:hypothetical protein